METFGRVWIRMLLPEDANVDEATEADGLSQRHRQRKKKDTEIYPPEFLEKIRSIVKNMRGKKSRRYVVSGKRCDKLDPTVHSTTLGP